MKPGPTGEYPEPPLNRDDEGQLVIGIRTEGEQIIVAFGTKVAWLGLDADDAVQLAALLTRHADAIRARRKRQ